MYCPRCGKQQVSGQLKFCPKCGFPMGLVAEVISHGGTLPQLEELSKKSKTLTRRNGMIFSLFWFLFFLLIVTPFWGIMDVEEMAAISAITGVFGGLLLFLFSVFFLGKPPKQYPGMTYAHQENQLSTGYPGQQNALPPHLQQTADEYVSPGPGSWRVPDTGDLATPGSVTEGTTKLLQKEEESE